MSLIFHVRFHFFSCFSRVIAAAGFSHASNHTSRCTIPTGESVDQVLAATGFTPVVPPHVPVTAPPSAEQVALLRTRIDPAGYRKRGVR